MHYYEYKKEYIEVPFLILSNNCHHKLLPDFVHLYPLWTLLLISIKFSQKSYFYSNEHLQPKYHDITFHHRLSEYRVPVHALRYIYNVWTIPPRPSYLPARKHVQTLPTDHLTLLSMQNEKCHFQFLIMHCLLNGSGIISFFPSFDKLFK